MNEKIAQLAASQYGKKCQYEKLVIAGSQEHNGLRYDHIIPWASETDEWVEVKTRITGSTIAELETRQIRDFQLVPEDSPTLKTYKPEPNQLMSWQDVKDWVDSMDAKELAQAAFIYTSVFIRPGGNHSDEQKIVGTRTKTQYGGFEAPRLIAETANF